ncbi:hypothetical protein Q0M94_25565 (plasmid) [Deinococcus radiomollis]|uniref:hypothetical protein n=1 Tax=Deinococcus radiomollis TaxID=468916 RepID=UPI0038912DBD
MRRIGRMQGRVYCETDSAWYAASVPKFFRSYRSIRALAYGAPIRREGVLAARLA